MIPAVPLRLALRRLAAGSILLLGLAGGAQAADPAPGWLSRMGEGLLSAADEARNAASAVWSDAVSLILPEAPFSYLPERLGESDLAFVAAMEDAGLTLAEIRAGGGLLPSVAYRFTASREASVAELQRAQRQLAAHRGRYGGLRALAQQRILQTVLDSASGGGFLIVDLEVTVRPWPAIRYVLGARARPLDDPQRRLLEQLRREAQANAPGTATR